MRKAVNEIKRQKMNNKDMMMGKSEKNNHILRYKKV